MFEKLRKECFWITDRVLNKSVWEHYKDIKSIQSTLKKNKIKPFKDVFESSYRAGRKTYKQLEILILDPDGYLLRFSQDI